MRSPTFNTRKAQLWGLILCGLMTVLAPTGATLAEESQSQPFSRTIAAADKKNLAVENTNGAVTITGGPGDQVIVEAVTTVKGKRDEVIHELLAECEINVKDGDDEISISVHSPSKKGYDVVITFTIQVPERFGVEASSNNGAVSISNVKGGVNATTVNGQVSCKQAAGPCEFGTVNGSIELEEINGEVEAGTINGSITLVCREFVPLSLDLNSINGALSVTLKRTPDARIEANTINGAISIAGEEPSRKGWFGRSWESTLGNGRGSYEFSTVNGSISLDITEPSNPD